MTSRAPLLLVALLALALPACDSGPEADATAEDTSGTARGLLSSVGDGEDRRIPEQPGVAALPDQEVSVDTLGYDFGDPDAPVRIVEFSDYGCGYCRRFHQQTWPVLKERYIDTGKVHWKFLPFVSGMFGNSLVATRAAECTLDQGPEPFLAVNARLWDDQGTWKGSGEPASVVRGMAEEAGVTMDEWDACMDANRRVDRIRAATGIAQELGVRGTPTFFVLGYPPLQGALPTETFTQLLDMVYAQETGGEEGP